MMTLADLLFGPRFPQTIYATTMRSRVGSAQMIFALHDRLLAAAADYLRHTPATEGAETSPVTIVDLNTNKQLNREDVRGLSPYELSRLAIQWSVYRVSWDNGPVAVAPALHGSPGDVVLADLVRIVERLSRPRFIRRRFLVLAPWIPVVMAAIALGVGWSEKVDGVAVFALLALVTTATGAAIVGSVTVMRAVGEFRPPTVIWAYAWHELAARRVTTTVGIVNALIGGVSGALLGFWLGQQ